MGCAVGEWLFMESCFSFSFLVMYPMLQVMLGHINQDIISFLQFGLANIYIKMVANTKLGIYSGPVFRMSHR